MSELTCPICGCDRDPGYKESIKYLCGYWETPGRAHISGCGNALQVVNDLRAQLNIEINDCDLAQATIAQLRADLETMTKQRDGLLEAATRAAEWLQDYGVRGAMLQRLQNAIDAAKGGQE